MRLKETGKPIYSTGTAICRREHPKALGKANTGAPQSGGNYSPFETNGLKMGKIQLCNFINITRHSVEGSCSAFALLCRDFSFDLRVPRFLGWGPADRPILLLFFLKRPPPLAVSELFRHVNLKRKKNQAGSKCTKGFYVDGNHLCQGCLFQYKSFCSSIHSCQI